jgi:hypothetical protein
MFGEDVVVLNSLPAVREALLTRDPQVAGRPDIFRIRYGFHYVQDIIFGTDSERWRQLKRTAGALLRSTSSPELAHVTSQMTEEMLDLAKLFEEQHGLDFDPSMILQTAVINVVSASVRRPRLN